VTTNVLKLGLRCSSVVKLSPSKYEALSSISRSSVLQSKKKKKKERKKR
jgi:hypothetical protein